MPGSWIFFYPFFFFALNPFLCAFYYLILCQYSNFLHFSHLIYFYFKINVKLFT